MDEDEIRGLLAAHMAELRRLVEMRAGSVSSEDARLRLDAFWRQACHLARVVDNPEMSAEQREIAVALVRLSRETVVLKKHEFQIHGGLDNSDALREDEGGNGGSPVGAWLRPGPPPRSGHDAKPFPPEELLFSGGSNDDVEGW